MIRYIYDCTIFFRILGNLDKIGERGHLLNCKFIDNVTSGGTGSMSVNLKI